MSAVLIKCGRARRRSIATTDLLGRVNTPLTYERETRDISSGDTYEVSCSRTSRWHFDLAARAPANPCQSARAFPILRFAVCPLSAASRSVALTTIFLVGFSCFSCAMWPRRRRRRARFFYWLNIYSLGETASIQSRSFSSPFPCPVQ